MMPKRISNLKKAVQACPISHSYMQEGSKGKERRPRTVLVGFLRMILSYYLMIHLYTSHQSEFSHVVRLAIWESGNFFILSGHVLS